MGLTAEIALQSDNPALLENLFGNGCLVDTVGCLLCLMTP